MSIGYFFCDSSVKGFEDVELINDLGEIHTLENYRLLLSKGLPIFRLPRNEVVFNLVHNLSENKLAYQGLLLGDIIYNLGSEYPYEQNDIKDCILSLISAGCFMREPEDAKLSEQNYLFRISLPIRLSMF